MSLLLNKEIELMQVQMSSLPKPIRLVGVIWGVEDAELAVAQDGDQDAVGVAVIRVGSFFQNSLLEKMEMGVLDSLGGRWVVEPRTLTS